MHSAELLEVYHRPYGDNEVLVCWQVSETRHGPGRLRIRFKVVRAAGVAPGGSYGPAYQSPRVVRWWTRTTRTKTGSYLMGTPIKRPVRGEPAEARRRELHAQAIMALELGVLARQCLSIPDQGVLRRETGAWQQQRNRDTIRVDGASNWSSPPSITTTDGMIC